VNTNNDVTVYADNLCADASTLSDSAVSARRRFVMCYWWYKLDQTSTNSSCYCSQALSLLLLLLLSLLMQALVLLTTPAKRGGWCCDRLVSWGFKTLQGVAQTSYLRGKSNSNPKIKAVGISSEDANATAAAEQQ
jgi:hypothetical protein